MQKDSSNSNSPWTPETDMNRVSVSREDKENGSPKDGDMIAHLPDHSGDRWLVSEVYFKANYEEAI